MSDPDNVNPALEPQTITVQRGENPRPDTGWPWILTPYEIAYIQAFNSRPVRGGDWAGSERDEVRLDDEATGIRAQAAPAKGKPKRARVPQALRPGAISGRPATVPVWVALTVSFVLVAAAVVYLSLGLANLELWNTFAEENSRLIEQLNG